MKSIEEQISNKCVHFNGVMNTCCEIGIKYSDVRIGKPYQFPCLKTGGECLSSKFPTEEQVKEIIAEITDKSNKTLVACLNIKGYYNKTKYNPGQIPCDCGGELKYIVAESNGHIRAKCDACGIYFME
ncbi:MAG: hypothetical protein V4560_14920 [Bacteroidota bacterium]